VIGIERIPAISLMALSLAAYVHSTESVRTSGFAGIKEACPRAGLCAGILSQRGRG
jgi:hypothetical protein